MLLHELLFEQSAIDKEIYSTLLNFFIYCKNNNIYEISFKKIKNILYSNTSIMNLDIPDSYINNIISNMYIVENSSLNKIVLKNANKLNTSLKRSNNKSNEIENMAMSQAKKSLSLEL